MLCCVSCRYDSHREAILQTGSHHQAGGDFVPTASKKSMDLFSFFSSSCFSGYNDSPKARQSGILTVCLSQPAGGLLLLFLQDFIAWLMRIYVVQGFYTVYRVVFEQLAAQELEAFEGGAAKAATSPDYPSFGEIMRAAY